MRDSQGNIINKVTKVGDPPVKNFLVLFMFTFFECYNPDQVLNNTAVDIGGNTRTLKADVYSGSGGTGGHATYNAISQIVIGNGANPTYSISKYKLDSQIGAMEIQTFGAFYNSTHMWILFRATWTNSGSDINITEVGLVWRNYVFYYYNYASFLVFYDVINPPITVPSGGSITISYYIYIRYA